MRAVAAKFDCEFVECRREWANYLDTHRIAVSNFLRDAIHLNDNGCVLMAELYERHFRINPAARGGWANQVRWYGARRSTEDHVEDQIVLSGGWRDGSRWVQSGATGDRLRLRFIGNRVDVVLAPGKGSRAC